MAKNIFKTLVTQAAVRSFVVYSLFVVFQMVCIFMFVLGPCFLMKFLVSFLVLQSSRAGCFSLVVLLLHDFPREAMGLSAVSGSILTCF